MISHSFIKIEHTFKLQFLKAETNNFPFQGEKAFIRILRKMEVAGWTTEIKRNCNDFGFTIKLNFS